ncbi:hypothetical protein ACF0H5_013938 [Mactra antiquata]
MVHTFQNNSRTSTSPVIPSPPQRRAINEESRDFNNQDGGPQNNSTKSYVGRPSTNTRQSDQEITGSPSVRPPSVRKRDIMMRRYNSASVLPRVTPVDLNRNHLVNAKDSYSSHTSCCNGNHSVHEGVNTTNGIGRSQSEQGLVQVDIVGESFEARYPWQRDISTQCNLSGDRGSVSSGVSLSSGISSCGDWNYYTDVNTQNCRNFIDSECNDKNDNNMSSSSSLPRRQSNEVVVRRRGNVARTRRPHSLTCLDSNSMYTNSNSDMYRSDSNLNYRHGRTASESSIQSLPNRKRMPLLVSEDPGSVSDLESIMENPHDDL